MKILFTHDYEPLPQKGLAAIPVPEPAQIPEKGGLCKAKAW